MEKPSSRAFRSLAEISASLRKRAELPPVTDLSSALTMLFHLDPGRLTAKVKGHTLVLHSEDKVVRFALSNIEGTLLEWLWDHSYTTIRRVTWSAE